MRVEPGPTSSDDERARLHALLREHGWNASSFQTLGSTFQYWFDGPEACVAYVDTGAAWIAAGAPIAPESRIADVAQAFVAEAARQERRASFFGTEPRFTERVPYRAVHIGEQPVWNPQHWDAVLRSSSSLREQVRRARAKGVSVRDLNPEELGATGQVTRAALDALLARWVESRRLPPMQFLVQLEPFSFFEDKLGWVALRKGSPVALLVAVPIYDRQGWLFENLLRDSNTPNGTTELLIDHAMRAVRDRGSLYVTLGLVPLSGTVGRLLRLARYLGQGFYDFEGLRQFKTKLRPSAWTPIFLSVPAPQSRTLAIYDVLNAFAGRSLGGFGLRALWTKPSFLARMLALSLVPWTAALALVGPRPWFPSVATWAAWLAFDVFLIVALLRQAGRWRRWLAIGLAALITGDALTTLVEALLFNLARVHGAASFAVLDTAVLGPSLASIFLWHAATRSGATRQPS